MGISGVTMYNNAINSEAKTSQTKAPFLASSLFQKVSQIVLSIVPGKNVFKVMEASPKLV